MELDEALRFATTLVDAPEIEEGMRALATWARRYRPYKASTVWREVPRIDWKADVSVLRGWVLEGMKALARKKDVELVVVDLGDSPEIFNTRGCKAKEDGAIAVTPGSLLDIDAVEWGNESNLCNHRLDELGGEVWKVFPLCDALPRLDIESGYVLWFGFATQVVAMTLRADVDLARVLGKRASVPLFMGFESLFLSLGTLTPRGWKRHKTNARTARRSPPRGSDR